MTRINLSIVLSTILLLFSACSIPAKKYFTGTIKYDYTYSSKFLNVDSLTEKRPAKGIFRYDEYNYQSQFIHTDTITYYYSGRLNKCIAETGSTNKYDCEDYSLITDSVLAIKDYATGEKIIGHPCRILELQKKNSVVKYYYSTDIKIAPATYKNHKAYNWDVYGTTSSGGLILKLEHQFKLFTMWGIATNINNKKESFKALEINDTLFNKLCK